MLIDEQKNLFSRVITGINKGDYLNLILGRPGLGKNLFLKKSLRVSVKILF